MADRCQLPQKPTASKAHLPVIGDIARQLAALDTGRYYTSFEWSGTSMLDACDLAPDMTRKPKTAMQLMALPKPG